MQHAIIELEVKLAGARENLQAAVNEDDTEGIATQCERIRSFKAAIERLKASE